MAITQYDNQSVPSVAKNLFYSKIGVLDQYVIMSTGENEYTLLAKNIVDDTVRQYEITRIKNSYENYYDCIEVSNPTWDYTITHEYYVYSNTGMGIMETLPVHAIISSWSMVGIVCIAALAVVFKGALYPCLRRLKNRW